MRHRNFRTLKVAAFWHQGPSGWQTGHPWLATEALHHVGFLALTANGSGGWGITQASYHDCHHDELNLTTFRTKYVPQVRSQSWEQRTTVLSDLIYDAGVSKFEGAKGTTVTISSHIKFFWCIPWFHPAKLAIFARPNWTPRNHRILRTETCNPDLFTYIIPVYCIYSILSRFSWTSINTWTITICFIFCTNFHQCSRTNWTRSFSKTSISISSWVSTNLSSPKHPKKQQHHQTHHPHPPGVTKEPYPSASDSWRAPPPVARSRRARARGGDAPPGTKTPRPDWCHRYGCQYPCMYIYICMCVCVYVCMYVCM